jgi:hypothetical protein
MRLSALVSCPIVSPKVLRARSGSDLARGSAVWATWLARTISTRLVTRTPHRRREPSRPARPSGGTERGRGAEAQRRAALTGSRRAVGSGEPVWTCPCARWRDVDNVMCGKGRQEGTWRRMAVLTLCWSSSGTSGPSRRQIGTPTGRWCPAHGSGGGAARPGHGGRRVLSGTGVQQVVDRLGRAGGEPLGAQAGADT